MYRAERILGSRRLVACCAPAQALAADALLRLLGELESCGPTLVDGARVPMGWCELAVVAEGDDLVLREPRFATDPFIEFADDISQTLAIVADQAAFAEQLGVARQPTAFDDVIAVAPGSLGVHRIFAERRASGWVVGTRDGTDEPPADDWIHLHVFELLALRPALLRVLSLPLGYLVALEGDVIETVLDDHDATIFPD